MTNGKIPFWIFAILLCACGGAFGQATASYPPMGFVYLNQALPGAQYDIRYYGQHNFTNRRVPGYEKPVALLTKEAATALRKVQVQLDSLGYQLKIFDAYRPQKAVNSFVKWARLANDTLGKREFYPKVNKRYLFDLGYIASRSGHSRGSTVDLTLVDKKTLAEIDMGSSFDFFGEISHHNTKQISVRQKANRAILRRTMEKFHFRAYQEEWWHYTLEKEPYPGTYFNFNVK